MIISPSFSTVIPGLLRWQSELDGPQQSVNSYLWHGPSGIVAIDPAADVPPQFADAGQIFITHVQAEHIAGASRLCSIPLYVSLPDAYLCAGFANYVACIERWKEPWDWESRGNFRGHVAGALNERPPLQALALTGTLCEGEEMAGLSVLSTPGHGKGALTFVGEIKGQRVAFCGDLICGDGHLWNWFDAEWDYGLQMGQKTLLDSARKLLSLSPDILYRRTAIQFLKRNPR